MILLPFDDEEETICEGIAKIEAVYVGIGKEQEPISEGIAKSEAAYVGICKEEERGKIILFWILD